MKLVKSFVITLIFVSCFAVVRADANSGGNPSNGAGDAGNGIGFLRYFDRTEYLLASPGAMGFGMYGYDNPALLQYLHDMDLALYWTSDDLFGDIPRYGAISAGPGFSFSFFNNDFDNLSYRDYRIALGGGTDMVAAGMAVNWYAGDTGLLDLKTNFSLGALVRPFPYLSVGLTTTSTIDAGYYENVVDLAVRPLGNPMLTLFGDYAFGDSDDNLFDGHWSAGASAEVLPGIRFTGRYLHDAGFTAGVQVSLGRAGISYQAHTDSDGNHRYNTYAVRSGALDRNMLDRFVKKDKHYITLDASGGLPYQRFRFFDKRPTFLSTLDQVYQAADDPTVSGIVINTQRVMLDQSKTWELRKALEDFQSQGKKVVVYIERGGMMTLHLASVADYVVMDPLGDLMIPGFASSRTYLADMLGAIGIGVDEFREMEYKSAFEALSRTSMSDAEREQTTLIIDRFYELVRQDVQRGRGVSEADFDALIDKGMSLSPADLVQAGIVDTLARFTEIDNIIETLEENKRTRISPNELFAYNKPRDDKWGPHNKIAVFYAEGPTMNESGIRARVLSRAIREAREDKNVKAVVLRADSPGGDALASDLVAEELRKTSEEKPVVVSMGSVAASGGYWISMYADTIVAAPNTITGSIGVISGWLWNEGFSDHLRLHSDQVSRGKSADLMTGPTLPLIGLTLPDRPLTAEEREGLIDRMNGLYDDFVGYVAEGRSEEFDRIRDVAAGRVWTGIDAQEKNLVDELGSLYAAIEIAKEMACIRPGDKVQIVEAPEAPPFSLPMFLSGLRYENRATGLLPRISGSRNKSADYWPAAADAGPVSYWGAMAVQSASSQHADPARAYLELMIEQNGNPLVILPFEYFSWMQYILHQH